MSRPSYVRTVDPTERPLSLAEVQLHLRIEDDEENPLLYGLIDGATGWAENYTWSRFVTQTWVMRMERFLCTQIPLHPNPVSSVSSVQYADTAGTTQTLTPTTDYIADIYQKPSLIYPAYNKWWPATRGFNNDVTVTLVAGYGAASAVPREIKLALLMLIGNWYEHRTAAGCDMTEIPFGVKPLLDNYSYRVPL